MGNLDEECEREGSIMAKSAFNPVKKKGITRRSFLATGAAATAALGLSGNQAFAD